MSQRTILTLVFVLAIIGSIAVAVSRRLGSSEEDETTTVQRTTIEHTVEFTGRVAAKQSVQLGFETSGTLQRKAVEIGDLVHAGDLLAALDMRSLSLELAKAVADRARATQLARTTLENAERTLTNTRAEQEAILARHRQSVRDAKRERDQSEEIWQQTVRESGEESSTTRIKYLAVVSAETTYKAAQQSLREAVETAEKTLGAAQGTVASARAEYRSTTQAAETVPGLSSAAATEQLARVRLSGARLLAPFDGVVTEVTGEAGGIVQASQAVVTIQSLRSIDIVADVPETDAVKLKKDMSVSMTLDAYGSRETWRGRVTKITSAARILEGVATFHVIVSPDTNDERLRPGMSVNLTVEVQRKERVLTLPRRAVIIKEDQEFVRVREASGAIIERRVKTGLIGSSGDIEIIEGLSEGDVVVVRTSKH